MTKQFSTAAAATRLDVNSNQNFAITMVDTEIARRQLALPFETKKVTITANPNNFKSEEEYQKAAEETAVVEYLQEFISGDTKYTNIIEPICANFSMKAIDMELKLRACVTVANRWLDIKDKEGRVVGERIDDQHYPFVLISVDKANFNYVMSTPSRNELISKAKAKAEADGKVFSTIDRMGAYKEQLIPVDFKEKQHIPVVHRGLNELERASYTSNNFDPLKIANAALVELLEALFVKYTISDDNLV